MSADKQPCLQFIRREQQQWRRKVDDEGAATAESIHQEALDYANTKQAGMKRDGDFLFEGVYKYPVASETRRFQRTIDIVNRAQPGRDEKPQMLAMLARQAASIELFLCGSDDEQKRKYMSEQCDRIVLATTFEPRFNGYAHRVGDCVAVVLFSGLIEFIYQAAKAVVSSWRRVDLEPGSKAALAFRSKPEDVEVYLRENPKPIELFCEILEAFLFRGFPRPRNSRLPSPEYHPPLSLLVAFAERYVIAHEYGHALMHELVPRQGKQSRPSDDFPPQWRDEFEADHFAFFTVANSGGELDLLPANIALHGEFFALHSMLVLREALDVARLGSVQPDRGTTSHPATSMRVELLRHTYEKEVPDDNPADSIEGALQPSLTLLKLWDKVKPRIEAIHQQGAKLHPIWTN